jgi:protein-tyrosine phosphatase
MLKRRERSLASKKSVCFVCLGNIVRSPLAEHLFLHKVEDRGLAHEYEAASAACGSWHVGESPDARMRRVAARHGLVYDGRARQFNASDFDRYDLVIAMDRDNLAHLQNLARNQEDRQKIHLLREFDPAGGPKSSVPDPYYGGIDGFEEVYQVIERSVEGLLDKLEKVKGASS